MTKLKLYVHCEINETIEMTFKIETKLDTWNINCKFQKKKKKSWKKIFFQKKFLKENFFQHKISKQKKISKKFFFSKKNY